MLNKVAHIGSLLLLETSEYLENHADGCHSFTAMLFGRFRSEFELRQKRAAFAHALSVEAARLSRSVESASSPSEQANMILRFYNSFIQLFRVPKGYSEKKWHESSTYNELIENIGPVINRLTALGTLIEQETDENSAKICVMGTRLRADLQHNLVAACQKKYQLRDWLGLLYERRFRLFTHLLSGVVMGAMCHLLKFWTLTLPYQALFIVASAALAISFLFLLMPPRRQFSNLSTILSRLSDFGHDEPSSLLQFALSSYTHAALSVYRANLTHSSIRNERRFENMVLQYEILFDLLRDVNIYEDKHEQALYDGHTHISERGLSSRDVMNAELRDFRRVVDEGLSGARDDIGARTRTKHFFSGWGGRLKNLLCWGKPKQPKTKKLHHVKRNLAVR